jgi:hypothetical protein
MRTQGAYYADTAHSGGWIFYDAMELASTVFLAGTASANMVLTRNAQGDYSLNRTAAGAEAYIAVQGLMDLKRLVEGSSNVGSSFVNGSLMPFQEQFGTSAGAAGYPAGAPGIPPFSGNTQLTQPTAQPAKGVSITDVVAVYTVGVASLTSASLALVRSTFANNAAIVTATPAISATALPLTAQANPYVVTRAVTAPTFETADLSDISVEFAYTMANTGTFRLYGMGIHVNFNYN